MATEKKEVSLRKYDLQDVPQMQKMSVVLKNHIVKNKLYAEISGKNYAMVDGWSFAGGLIGVSPKIVSVENLSSGTEKKWRADVELINQKTGVLVGTGIAICSNLENKKKSFDEYAILSMAQTRAIGKAYRNTIGWVMKLAGYEATPSEEMHKVGDEPKQDSPHAEPVIQMSDYVCHGAGKGGCPDGASITKQENDFSMKIFKKPLCRNCQARIKGKK